MIKEENPKVKMEQWYKIIGVSRQSIFKTRLAQKNIKCQTEEIIEAVKEVRKHEEKS